MDSKALIGFCAGIIMLGTSSVTLASPPPQPPTTILRYGDLDLTRTAGRDTLRKRTISAARRVCSHLHGRDFTSQRLYADCYRAAVDAATSRVYRVAGSVGR